VLIELISKIEISKVIEFFFATFVGVWAAFSLERLKRNKEHSNKKLEQFIYVQGSLQLQRAFVDSVIKYLAPLKEDSQRTGKLLPIRVKAINTNLLLSDLRFLLGKENVLALNIINLQNKINMSVSTLQNRDVAHDVIQTSAHTSAIDGDKHLYNVAYMNLSYLTDIVYENFYELEGDINDFYSELEKIGLNQFQGVVSKKLGFRKHNKPIKQD
jgi:uncharacterized protein YlxP (DUF503 family)